MTGIPAGGRSSPRAFLARLLAKGGYGRAVTTLMSGTVGAQAIGILSILVLARLYTPADFGAFAFVLAASILLALVGTAHYEGAAYLAETEEQAAGPVALSLLVLVVMTATVWGTAVVLESLWRPLAAAIQLPALELLVAASMLTGGAVTALTAFAIQTRAFATVAQARLLQALMAAAVSIGAGLVGTGGIGLVLGLLVGQLAFLVLVAVRTGFPRHVLRQSRHSLAAVARTHHRFPLYTLPGSLLNSVGTNFIAFVTPSTFGAAALGQYNLGQRTAALPASVVGSAMGDVFRAAISPQHLDRAQVAALFDRTAKRLALAGLALCLPLLLAGPQLFEIVFGSHWREAGLIVQILSPLIFARLVVSPLSAVLLLTGRNALDGLLQALFLVAAGIAFWIGWSQASFIQMIVWIAILQTLIYGVFLAASYRAARALSR